MNAINFFKFFAKTVLKINTPEIIQLTYTKSPSVYKSDTPGYEFELLEEIKLKSMNSKIRLKLIAWNKLKINVFLVLVTSHNTIFPIRKINRSNPITSEGMRL